VTEPDEEALLQNMLTRGRGIETMTMQEVRTEAHAKVLFGQWISDEAQRLGLPVIESRPFDTLAQRILAVKS
jgi:hypothetical protein